MGNLGGIWEKKLDFASVEVRNQAPGRALGSKIDDFSMKINDFEQNDGILRLWDGPNGLYGGTYGL